MKRFFTRKKLIVLSLIIVCAAGISLTLYKVLGDKPKMRIEEVKTLGQHITYGDVETLCDNSDLIVVASPLKDFMDREHVNRYETYPIKHLINYVTKTDIRIEKVLKQPTDSLIKVGDILTVTEPASVEDYPERNLRQIIKSSGYEPIQKGNRYILFLKKSPQGNYSIINLNNGRFNLDKAEKQENDIVKKFKESVLKKFENELK